MGDAFETFSGLKVVTLVFALIGGALGISYTPEITPRMAFAALLSALVFGALGPEVIAFWWGKPLPIMLNNLAAVVLGVLGMFIVPGILVLGKKLRDDPFGFFDSVLGVLDRARGNKRGADVEDKK